MAGGTYHDHADVEKFLGVTLASSGEWPLDSDVDNMCIQTEGEAATAIYPFTLAQADTNSSAGTKAVLVKWTLYNLFVADKWRRARGATTSSTGSVSFPDLDLTPPEVLALQLQKLAAGTPSWDTAPMIKDDDYDG